MSGFLFDPDDGEPVREDSGTQERLDLAADILESERFLLGAERSFLEEMVARRTIDFIDANSTTPQSIDVRRADLSSPKHDVPQTVPQRPLK